MPGSNDRALIEHRLLTADPRVTLAQALSPQ